MTATLDQLSNIRILSALDLSSLMQLQPDTTIRSYLPDEIIMHEGDRLPPHFFAISKGTLRISKMTELGKETILRLLGEGEMFAGAAIFGNGIAPATVTAETPCQILSIERSALLGAIGQNPNIALQIVSVLNERIQQLHQTVHGLISERAIVRLIRLIEYYARANGCDSIGDKFQLKARLSHYQIARSIGITYEECVRLFKQLKPTVLYQRGGKISVLDWQQLTEIAQNHSG